MKAVVFDKIGPPLDVLYLAEVPTPQLNDGEVLIRLIAAPISPGDFLFIENLYPEPKKPRFPRQIGGNHGLGVVEQARPDAHIEPGTLVAFSHYNSWAEYAAVPVEWLMPLPANFPIEKGAQFFNLISAWDLLTQSRVQAGQWLAVTAGYSAVSIMVTQFARQRGVNVISIVRRVHDHFDLKTLGATEVIDISKGSQNTSARAKEITHNQGVNAIIDSAGGPATGELIRAMAFGGQVIINGGMSPERFELHNFDVLLNGLEIKAHVYRYFFTPPQISDRAVLQQIVDASGRADFQVPLGGLHPLEDFKQAIGESMRNPARGKHFFQMQFA